MKTMEMERKVVKSSRFKKVYVFCGSTAGKRNCYSYAALDLAQDLVARRLDLVYDGGSIGLMCLISRAFHHAGGNVIGIIPRTLMQKRYFYGIPLFKFSIFVFIVCSFVFNHTHKSCFHITGDTVGEVSPVADMHRRKAEMARHSDCFIALPGGYGTLEELLEGITWAQLGIHDKPVGLLNVDGYYNYLLTLIDKAADDGFIRPSQRNIIVCASNAKELIKKLEEYVPVHEGAIAKSKWEIEQQPKQRPSQQQVEVNATALQTEIAL